MIAGRASGVVGRSVGWIVKGWGWVRLDQPDQRAAVRLRSAPLGSARLSSAHAAGLRRSRCRAPLRVSPARADPNRVGPSALTWDARGRPRPGRGSRRTSGGAPGPAHPGRHPARRHDGGTEVGEARALRLPRPDDGRPAVALRPRLLRPGPHAPGAGHQLLHLFEPQRVRPQLRGPVPPGARLLPAEVHGAQDRPHRRLPGQLLHQADRHQRGHGGADGDPGVRAQDHGLAVRLVPLPGPDDEGLHPDVRLRRLQRGAAVRAGRPAAGAGGGAGGAGRGPGPAPVARLSVRACSSSSGRAALRTLHMERVTSRVRRPFVIARGPCVAH